MTSAELRQKLTEKWPDRLEWRAGQPDLTSEVTCPRDLIAEICGHLFLEEGLSFAGLIVEEGIADWALRYGFYGDRSVGWIFLVVNAPLAESTFPSVVTVVHAADSHEREAEELFGVCFEGRARLGEFVLHEDSWRDDAAPMRHRFDAHTPVIARRPTSDRHPRRNEHERGTFGMPIGPVFAGVTESVHFLLDTVGEDVLRAVPRLFYKYRGIEKIAEGQSVTNALLLAERFAATTAFAHALGFCHSVEAICRADVPTRAQHLRVFVAELERLRHHVAAIEGICESTALVVAASQAGMLEEELLRTSGALAGHRYFFGLATPGGLTTDLDDDACVDALGRCRAVLARLDELERMLRFSSSFLDRLEEVGLIQERDAREFGLVGPIARASGIGRDLRAAQPYGAYGALAFDVPTEREGDGYARLRILFSESRQSVRLMEQAAAALTRGPIVALVRVTPGAAMGWVEAPRGAAFHWVRLGEDGTVARYRIVPPSFINWLGFHLSVEAFAFQDFSIILSTLDLSVAENDR